MLSNSSPLKNIFIQSQNTKPAWFAISAFVFCVVVLIVVGAAKILSLLYPLGSLVVGIFLYKRYPIMYISFTIWLTFLSNLVAKLNGYHLGGLGPLGGAFLIVPFLTIFAVLKHVPNLYKNKDGLPFISCLIVILYGSTIKLIRQPMPDLNSLITSELSYITPILLGLYLYINWQDYPKYREVMQKTFLWIVLVTSLYGIWQFLVAPAWDTHFMRVTWGENSWMGRTEPFSIRVFSTLSHPYAFAVNLLPGLVLLNISSNKLRWIALPLGYLAIILTAYRTAWYTLFIALFLQVISLKMNRQIYVLSSLIIVTILMILFVNIEPFSTFAIQRFETFSNLSDDSSALERIEQFQNATKILLTEFIGYGNDGQEELSRINNNNLLSGYDMGFYQFLACYGWIGTITYGIGILSILSKLFQSTGKLDVFAISARAIVFASVLRVATSSILLYEFAFPLWLFIGVSMAAYKYNKYHPLTR
jgi:O-Antigen ligase